MLVQNVVPLGLMFMKSNIKIKSKQNSLNLIKETEEDRKERIKYSSTMFTKIIPDKIKIYSRKQKHKENYEDID